MFDFPNLAWLLDMGSFLCLAILASVITWATVESFETPEV
jgi:hypothetical protein